MTSRNGVTGVVAGQKRPADDGFDPLTSPISLKSTPPYDANQEQAPFSVVKSKEYATYKTYEGQIKQLLTEPFKTLQNPDKFLQELKEKIVKRIAGQKQQKIVVCLTGPMGAGKSATLNSLLGIPIARQGDLGGSCTLTSCKYSGPKIGQETAFLAEVKFFDWNERRAILDAYLASYYRATHQDTEDEGPSSEAQQPLEDAEANVNDRDEAITVMYSLFGDQRECNTKEKLRHFLDQAESADDENILKQLYKWCDNLITKATGGQPAVTISASTAEELSRRLEDFTAYAEDDNGDLAASLTPMVSLINFYFDNPLTHLGLTFLDTPGTTDSNRARRKGAQQHRKDRTHCIVLSDESRVQDDREILKEIASLQRRGLGRTVIVATKSDLIHEKTEPKGSKKDKEQLEQMKKGLERFRNELRVIEIQESDAVENGDIGKVGKLALEKRELEIRIKLLENAGKALRIKMRRLSNKKAVQDKLRENKLSAPIYSISNTEYARHAEGFMAKHTPVLTVEETMIPDLRRHLSTIPNEARLNEMRHQQKSMLPPLLKGIRVYIEKGPSEHRESLEIHVNYPLKVFAQELAENFSNIDRELIDLLRVMGKYETIWAARASNLCEQWAEEFNTPVFLNLLKRDGLRKGNRRNREVDLSADLIDITSDVIDDLFHRLGNSLKDYEGLLARQMADLVDNMIEYLDVASQESLMSLEPFYVYLHAEKAQFAVIVQEAFDKLIEGLEDIRRKLVSPDEDAYLVEAMLPIYDQIRQLKGGRDQKGPRPKVGWPTHRKITFKTEVTKLNGLWASTYSKVVSETKHLLGSGQEYLVERFAKVFGEFYSSFDAMCKVDTEADPETGQFHHLLKVNCEKAEELLNGPMKQAYDTLERDFRGIAVYSD